MVLACICLSSIVDKRPVVNYCMHLYAWFKNLKYIMRCYIPCTEVACFYEPGTL